MTEDNGGYDLQPAPEKPAPAYPSAAGPIPNDPSTGASAASSGEATGLPRPGNGPPKPGEPGWVPPVPIVEYDTPDGQAPVDREDLEKHRGMAVLAYLLFLIPLVAAPNSKFARYHANQGLLLFIALISVCVLVGILQFVKILSGILLARVPVLDWFFGCGIFLLQPGLLISWAALMIVGFINAANGLRKPLPGIGHWTLIK